jgi:hypothetical protein
MTVEEYLIERLKEVDPRLYPKILDELEKRLRRKAFQLIKGAATNPSPTRLRVSLHCERITEGPHHPKNL